MEVTQSFLYQSIKLLQAPNIITTTICIYLVFFSCWKMQGDNVSWFFSSSAENDNEPPGSSSFFYFFLGVANDSEPP